MEKYTIKKVNGKIDWENVPTLPIDKLRKAPYTDATAEAKICHDGTALHIFLTTKDSDVFAEQSGPLGQPSEDSCLEYFFCPEEGDDRYFNFEWNSVGCLFLGLGKNLPELVRLLPEEETAEELFCPEITVTKDGFSVYFRVEADFIRRLFPTFALKSGKIIRANCYKCGGRKGNRHYLTWSTVLDTENFHAPHRFGEMIIE